MNMMRRATSAAVTLAVLGGSMLSGSTSASASSEACWRAERSNTLSKVGVDLLESDMVLRWCASDGVVTKFWVDLAETTPLNSAWVGQPDEPVVLRTSDFGHDVLYVVGNFTAPSTISDARLGGGLSGTSGNANVALNWKPGRIGDHYQVQLHANGVITGSVISG